MSIQIMDHVFRAPLAKTATEQVVLLAIADHCNDEGCNAWPSIKTIARKARLTERAVYGAIERLKARGVLHVTSSGSRRGTNLYRIVLTASNQLVDGADQFDEGPAFIMSCD